MNLLSASFAPDFIFFVVGGTTFGIMITNVQAVLLSEQTAQRMPIRLVHALAPVIFAILCVTTLN